LQGYMTLRNEKLEIHNDKILFMMLCDRKSLIQSQLQNCDRNSNYLSLRSQYKICDRIIVQAQIVLCISFLQVDS
jgi:hypothetical protein